MYPIWKDYVVIQVGTVLLKHIGSDRASDFVEHWLSTLENRKPIELREAREWTPIRFRNREQLNNAAQRFLDRITEELDDDYERNPEWTDALA